MEQILPTHEAGPLWWSHAVLFCSLPSRKGKQKLPMKIVPLAWAAHWNHWWGEAEKNTTVGLRFNCSKVWCGHLVVGKLCSLSWKTLPEDIVICEIRCLSPKNPPALRETWIQSLGWEDPLEKGKATPSGILAGRIPWTVHGIANNRTRLSNFHSLTHLKKVKEGTRVGFRKQGLQAFLSSCLFL